MEHLDVVDVAVIGKKELLSGEVSKAFVVKCHGGEVATEELMASVAVKVATFKHVREVEFVDSIPKNGSGKMLR